LNLISWGFLFLCINTPLDSFHLNKTNHQDTVQCTC
jgi:hypothetical protein